MFPEKRERKRLDLEKVEDFQSVWFEDQFGFESED